MIASSQEPPELLGQVSVVVDSKEQLASKEDVNLKRTQVQPEDEGDVEKSTVGTKVLNSPVAAKPTAVSETPPSMPLSRKKGKKSRAANASPSAAQKAAASPNPTAKVSMLHSSNNLRMKFVGFHLFHCASSGVACCLSKHVSCNAISGTRDSVLSMRAAYLVQGLHRTH